MPPRVEIHCADNLEILRGLSSDTFDLIYIDPPFNTGKKQAHTQIKTVRDPSGDRTGFKGERYRTVRVGTKAFGDNFDDYLAFLEPRLHEAHRVLKPTGSFFLHLDYREAHYSKVLLDGIFGVANAGGVDQRHRIAIEIKLHLDHVARGAGVR